LARGCLFGFIVSAHFDPEFQYRRKPSILSSL